MNLCYQIFCRDVDIARLSMASLDVNGVSTSERLIREFGTRGMTLDELAGCLYSTGKYERCLLKSRIKQSGNTCFITKAIE